MIGCKFCRIEENGDYGADLTPLVVMGSGWKPISKGMTAKTIDGRKSQTTQLMEITVFRDNLNVCFNGEFEFERKIKYCPMCGREL